jgi:hypothetical protein
MLVRVTWINGNETDFQMGSLRELDTFVGQHAREGIVADFKPMREGVRLLFQPDRRKAA